MSDPTTYADQEPRTSTGERTVTVLLMIGLAALVPVASLFAMILHMLSDGCPDGSECGRDQVGVGVAVAAWSPWAVYVAALVLVVRRWVRGRSTWWVPLVALVIGVAFWALGRSIALSAVSTGG